MTLLAIYDLAVSPTSYDFTTFLALADLERRRADATAMHVIFVPAAGEGFWSNEALDVDQKRWRIRNMLVPLCWLWPSCHGVTVLTERDDAKRWLGRIRGPIFPVGYRLDRPVVEAFLWAAATAEYVCGENLPPWTAPAQAQAFVQQWLGARALGKRVVAITLREARYHSEINSNIAAWAAFARSLDPRRYLPVIIRDTEASFDQTPKDLEGLTIFPEAALNVELRAALYEQSFIGLSVGTGPMQLQWLNPSCRFIVFRLVVPENVRSQPTPLRAMGLEVGGQLTTPGRFHRLVWEDDRLDVIRREFERMVAEIDGAVPASMPTPDPPLRVARRLRETHRLVPARRIYRHLIAVGRDRVAARYGLSLLELATPRRLDIWRYLRALRYYAQARLMRPSLMWRDPDEALEIADARLRWRETAAAEAIYRSVLEAVPNEATALHRLGLLALRRGAADEAVDLMGKAVAADPYRAANHYDLAEALRAVGRLDEAADHYRAAATQDPSHQRARDAVNALLGPIDGKGAAA
jgi:tetratricopeptide (TPR) repeat protein